jgi:hypothetical protein
MTLAIRFIPNAGRKVIYAASGRSYSSSGATVDIPFPDADTIQPDQATRLIIVGTTADRPRKAQHARRMGAFVHATRVLRPPARGCRPDAGAFHNGYHYHRGGKWHVGTARPASPRYRRPAT